MGLGRMVMLILGATLKLAVAEDFPPVPLSVAEKGLQYQQARLTSGARQIGLSCAFYANVPLVTMSTGINIADGSVASKEFVASIYGLRRGEFSFMSAFDRGMFFELFRIPSKEVKTYYREAPRGDLLADAEEVITLDLTPEEKDSIKVSLKRGEGAAGVAASFPEVDFATEGDDAKSVIGKNLDAAKLRGVYNLTKLALNTYHLGKREALPVWLLDGEPFVVTGYSGGEGSELILSDGSNRSVISLAEALGQFKKSECFFGYVEVPKD